MIKYGEKTSQTSVPVSLLFGQLPLHIKDNSAAHSQKNKHAHLNPV